MQIDKEEMFPSLPGYLYISPCPSKTQSPTKIIRFPDGGSRCSVNIVVSASWKPQLASASTGHMD
jgi:hypothetical protein